MCLHRRARSRECTHGRHTLDSASDRVRGIGQTQRRVAMGSNRAHGACSEEFLGDKFGEQWGADCGGNYRQLEKYLNFEGFYKFNVNWVLFLGVVYLKFRFNRRVNSV